MAVYVFYYRLQIYEILRQGAEKIVLGGMITVPKETQQMSTNKLQIRMILKLLFAESRKSSHICIRKVLLGSEGPGSTKAVYVAQAGLFYFFIGVPELRRRKYSSGKCDSVLKNL